MSVIYIDLDVSYKPLTENEDIKIKVIIGDGQSGGYMVFLGQQFIAANKTANIGNKAVVAGNISTIVVTIMDKLTQTNWTSVTLEVKEGNKKTVFGPFQKQVPPFI